MAQRPDLSKYLDAGAQFVALTRSQARARAKELVGQGQLAQEQVQGFVDALVDESRRRTDEMLEIVRREIQRQVKLLGVATKDDLARLEARVAKRNATATKPAKKGGKAKGSSKASGKAKKPSKSAKAAKPATKGTRKQASATRRAS